MSSDRILNIGKFSVEWGFLIVKNFKWEFKLNFNAFKTFSWLM